MTKQEMVQGPIFFERNRVGRIYTGGKLFADFFGDHRGEVALLVATLGRGNYRPVAQR